MKLKGRLIIKCIEKIYSKNINEFISAEWNQIMINQKPNYLLNK